jgi:hypothetical protein
MGLVHRDIEAISRPRVIIERVPASCETGRSSHRPKPRTTRQEAESSSQEERRPREGADDGADSVARGRLLLANCDFNLAVLHPAYPIKCRTSAQRTQASQRIDTPEEPLALDPLENGIRHLRNVREHHKAAARISLAVGSGAFN